MKCEHVKHWAYGLSKSMCWECDLHDAHERLETCRTNYSQAVIHIGELEQEVKRLQEVNIEYKRQAIEYANELEQLKLYK